VPFGAAEIIIKKPAFRRALPSPLGGVFDHPRAADDEFPVFRILGHRGFPLGMRVGGDDPFPVVGIVQQHGIHGLRCRIRIGRADDDVVVAALGLPVGGRAIAVVLHVLRDDEECRGALGGGERRVGGGVHARIVTNGAQVSTPMNTYKVNPTEAHYKVWWWHVK